MQNFFRRRRIRLLAVGGVTVLMILGFCGSGHPFPKVFGARIGEYLYRSQQSELTYQEWNKQKNQGGLFYKISVAGLMNRESYQGALVNGAVETMKKTDGLTNEEAAAIENQKVVDEELSVQAVGPISYIFGESYTEDAPETQETETPTPTPTEVKPSAEASEWVASLYKNKNRNEMLRHFFIVDGTTSIDKKMFPVAKLLSMDHTIQKSNQPQILIYHTHGASEAFKGKQPDEDGGIISMGNQLTDTLTKKYGYQVIHDKTKYDWIDGSLDRSRAYAKALPAVKKHLSENPSIEVVIDLHRDGVAKNQHSFATVNGVKMAQVMFFNGLSRNKKKDIPYLSNPNLTGNLSFSLQMKLMAEQYYAGLTKPIYLKGYRYNLHLKKRSLLVELGNQNNTYEEASNAIPALADVLDRVLSNRKG